MENGLVSPLCLVVIKIVLGEAAGIHDAEMRVDTWPLVRRGFAAIIETGPGKSAGHPRTLGINRPPIFSELGPGRNVGGLFIDRKSTRLNSSHRTISYAVFCLKKNKEHSAVDRRISDRTATWSAMCKAHSTMT